MNYRSVCFFMLYHKRPEITRMSMWHMKKVIDRFNAAGHKAQGIVFGDEEDQKKYADFLGIEHIAVPNSPLSKKFQASYMNALWKKADYVCKIDSNNFNDFSYWDKCIEFIKGSKVVSFGTNRFTIISSDKKKEDTCVFKTRKTRHLCNSGQFYLTYSLDQAVDFTKIYPEKATNNFDGRINDAIMDKWRDESLIHTISSNPDDCFDVKDGTDIHSYDSYIRRSPRVYPKYQKRSKLVPKYKELTLLDQGFFREECYKIFEPEA